MVIDTISKDEVDALAKSLLSYLSHYNQEHKVRWKGGGAGLCSAGRGAPCLETVRLCTGTLCNPCSFGTPPSSMRKFYHIHCFSLQLLEEYEADPSSWAWPGPTRATAIVACLPAFMDASGHSTGGGAPMQRGASLATTQHVDPAAVAGGWRVLGRWAGWVAAEGC